MFWKNTQEKSSNFNLNLTSFPLKQQIYDNYVYYLDIFTPKECVSIIDYCKLSKEPEYGLIGDGIGSQENKKVRNSLIRFFEKTDETGWIFDKLFAVMDDCNNNWYNFDVRHFGEGFQFTEYQEGMFYDWHQDYGAEKFSNRKLSMVVNLSESDAYEGGDLEFFCLKDKRLPRSIGSVIVFPSFEPHRVTELVSGTRYSLVSWVQGPPFR